MLNINFIEKKLNDLEDGKYQKNLSGKTYDIEVKNIDENNKLIKVYESNKLIINFNYYKNGKVIEGENNMNENITLNNLIEKLLTLKEGFGNGISMTIESENVNL